MSKKWRRKVSRSHNRMRERLEFILRGYRLSTDRLTGKKFKVNYDLTPNNVNLTEIRKRELYHILDFYIPKIGLGFQVEDTPVKADRYRYLGKRGIKLVKVGKAETLGKNREKLLEKLDKVIDERKREVERRKRDKRNAERMDYLTSPWVKERRAE